MHMQRLKNHILAVLTLMAGGSVHGFTLMGDFEDWQVPEIGYNLTYISTDIGAPKNLGEEYRYSTPVLTYGFDASWLDYFGLQGISAVDAAFEEFNRLPPVSTWSDQLTEFPLTSTRINHSARFLQLVDVKSQTMGIILEQLGLGSPERFTFALRSRVVINDVDYYTVIRRNFDPITFLPSPFVNGTLYTYRARPIIWRGETVGYDAQELAVDASEPNLTVVGASGVARTAPDLIDPRVEERADLHGVFFTGLTRDDAGGIRYLFSPNNRNFELPPAGSGPRTTNGIVITAGGTGGGGQSPWTPVSAVVAGEAAPGPVDPTQTDPGLADPTAPVAGTQFIEGSVRRGVDKLAFVRVDMDPLLGTFARPFIVRYTETVQQAGITRNQTVERILTRPDMLFAANDLGVTDVGTPTFYSRTINHVNNAAISGIIGQAAGGPGNLDIPVNITFSRVGPYNLNTRFTAEEFSVEGSVWGSFNGTTNSPVVFPQDRVSLRELERIVRGR